MDNSLRFRQQITSSCTELDILGYGISCWTSFWRRVSLQEMHDGSCGVMMRRNGCSANDQSGTCRMRMALAREDNDADEDLLMDPETDGMSDDSLSE